MFVTLTAIGGTPATSVAVSSRGGATLSSVSLTPKPVGFTPTQIRGYYRFNAMGNDGLGRPIDGRGQVIGIVLWGAEPNLKQEVLAFDAQFGLEAMNGLTTSTPCTVSHSIHTPPCFELASAGGTTPHYIPGQVVEGAGDVEWAHVTAPGADIVFVQGQVTKLSNGTYAPTHAQLLQAVDAAVAAGASVVSMSWGSSAITAADNAHFDVATAGFVGGIGDFGCPDPFPYPAASSYVLSVGGTVLNKSLTSETAWNLTGGFVNHTESRPSYQLNWQPSVYRVSNDVAYNALSYPTYIINSAKSKGWDVFNGVSAGIPQWAGLVADADQARAALGKSVLAASGLLDGIYLAANSHEPQPGEINKAMFNDITSGSGGNGCSASKGWDIATGLGSPRADGLVTELADI